ncbi:MAG: PHP domain-containing protein [Nitrospirae bacterium]|nr:PHP domain-containing protein [Nitrospirota bacterium]
MAKKRFLADLHIHSCLSPCSELDMTPRAIVNKAIEQGIDIIAITDHNSMRNVPAAIAAASGTRLTVLTGMEITTCEEIHILALFDSNNFNNDFNEIIYSNLPDIKNNVKHFGYQIVVNCDDEVIEFVPRLLISSIMIELEPVLGLIHKFNGIAIPAHIDKEQFSIISQIGFIPEGLKVEALEVSRNTSEEEKIILSKKYQRPIVSFSDAHFLSDFGSNLSELYLEAPTFDEIKKKLTHKLRAGAGVPEGTCS